MESLPKKLWVLTLAVSGACKPSADQIAKEAAARDEAERLRARAAIAARKTAENAEANAKSKELAVAEENAKREKQQRVDSFRRLDTNGRAAEIRKVCPAGECDRSTVWLIVQAADSDAEKKSLQQLAEKLIAADQKAYAAATGKKEASLRKAYADGYEIRLLERHMNPDGVRATGRNNTTLLVTGWFCSKQFVYDFMRDAGNEVRNLRFVKLECQSGIDTWWQEL